MEFNNKLNDCFYKEIMYEIKNYLPASYGTPELKEIMGRVTLVIDDKMVDLEGYVECYDEYVTEHGIALAEGATVEWDEDKGIFYYEYEDTTEMTSLILPEIAKRLQDSKYQELQRKFTDYEHVEENILMKMSSFAHENYPYQDTGICGLVVVYEIYSYEALRPALEDGYSNNFRVTHDMLSAYGLTQEQLHQLAFQNTQRRYPPELIGFMEEQGFRVPKKLECMYVLEGGTALMDQSFMEQVTERLGEVYVIPPYFSNVILVPTDKAGSQLEAELQYLSKIDSYYEDPHFGEYIKKHLNKEHVFKHNQFQKKEQEELKHLMPANLRKKSKSI